MLLPYLIEAGMKISARQSAGHFTESGTGSFQRHASTLVRLPCGTLRPHGSRLREGSEDTAIWLSRYEHNIWTTPQRVAAREGKRTGIRCYLPNG